MTRDEARAWFTRFLLERVRREDYPSTTQLDLIEESIPATGAHDLAPLCSSLASAGRLAGYLATERFYEIGSPSGLAEASALLAHRAGR